MFGRNTLLLDMKKYSCWLSILAFLIDKHLIIHSSEVKWRVEKNRIDRTFLFIIAIVI